MRKEGRRGRSVNKEGKLFKVEVSSRILFIRDRNQTGYFGRFPFRKLDGLMIAARAAPPSAKKRWILLALIGTKPDPSKSASRNAPALADLTWSAVSGRKILANVAPPGFVPCK